MMFFAKGLVVNLPSAELRERLNQALRDLPDALQDGSADDPIALVTSAETPARANPGMAVVRLWTTGREPGVENPFLDPSVRHVLGAAPMVDSGHLASTMRHLVAGTPVGLADLLPHPKVNRGFRIEQAEHRGALQVYLEQLLKSAGVPPKVAAELYTFTDELIANAMYDAPVENGQRLFAATSRKQAVPFVKPIDVEVAADAQTAVVLVRDHFGSLSPQAVVTNLRRCFGSHQQQIDQKAGGAGLGLFMALTGSSRLVFNINPGHSTEVLLTRKYRLRPAELRASAPTVNICVADTGSAASVEAASATEQRGSEDTRRWPRRVTRLIGVSAVGGVVVPSAFLDLTEQGAFVRPLGRVEVVPGQAVLLTVFDKAVAVVPAPRNSSDSSEWKLRPVISDLPATVRWVGTSEEHSCDGFGVEFETPCEAVQALVKD